MNPESPAGAAEESARRVALALDDSGVSFVVDGSVVRTFPRELYESLQEKLAANPDSASNAFLLEMGTGEAPLRLWLPPLAELGAVPLELRTEDGVHYGRHYRLEIIKSDAGERLALLSDAQSGAEVARIPWGEFVQRVKDDKWRSATPCRTMLGEYDPSLHLRITARRYRPAPKGEPVGREESRPVERVAEPHMAATRAWLNSHPGAAYSTCALALIIALAGVIYATASRGPVFRKQKMGLADPMAVETLINRCEATIKSFEIMIVDDPELASRSLVEMHRFLASISGRPLSKSQKERVEKLQQRLPELARLVSKVKRQ